MLMNSLVHFIVAAVFACEIAIFIFCLAFAVNSILMLFVSNKIIFYQTVTVLAGAISLTV